MLGDIGGEDESRDELLDFVRFVRTVTLKEVDLAVFFENAPKRVQVHLLQHALIIGLHSQLTLFLDLKGIGRAGMVQIVRKGSNEGIKPLFFGQAAT